MFEAKFYIQLWGDAIYHANWLRYQLPAQTVSLQTGEKLTSVTYYDLENKVMIPISV